MLKMKNKVKIVTTKEEYSKLARLLSEHTLEGLITSYSKGDGKYALLGDGYIVQIRLWSTTLDKQEIHIIYKRKNQWVFFKDIIAVSDNKKYLKEFRIHCNPGKMFKWRK